MGGGGGVGGGGVGGGGHCLMLMLIRILIRMRMLMLYRLILEKKNISIFCSLVRFLVMMIFLSWCSGFAFLLILCVLLR